MSVFFFVHTEIDGVNCKINIFFRTLGNLLKISLWSELKSNAFLLLGITNSRERMQRQFVAPCHNRFLTYMQYHSNNLFESVIC
jgi:hypothetical protein